MLRRTILILLPALMLSASMSEGEYWMRIHEGATVEGHPIAEIDSLSFYKTPPMVRVPAGVFVMGDGATYCGTREHQVTLTRDFYLGQHEVTNEEYRCALQWAYDQGYVTAISSVVTDNLDGSTATLVDLASSYCQISFSGGTFTVDPGKENHPVIEVSWYGAAAYCDWLSVQVGVARAYDHSTWQCNSGNPYTASGHRLPTDAEWEYAAQYDDERWYPWGNESADCSRANFYSCIGTTSPVGSYPDAPAALGLSDMAGNVWEWCNDWWVCDLGTGPVIDPVGPVSGTDRVLHGGSWYSDSYTLPCAFRGGTVPSYPDYGSGFRCARSQ
ncbi:MAG: SUMF1/EgtB/PvdO family nonheme iron enzyme [Candidatus Eisenbacteria bacterium]